MMAHLKRTYRRIHITTLLVCVCLISSGLLLNSRLYADTGYPAPAKITPTLERLDLIPYMGLLEDKSGSLSFEQISSVKDPVDFQAVGNRSPNFGFTESTWWVKLQLHNAQNAIQQLTIRQDYPLIDLIDFWYQDQNAQWQHITTGDKQPFHNRPIDHRSFLFPVTLAPSGTSDIYIRFETQGSMNIGLFAHSEKNLIDLVGKEYLSLGIYYGGFIVLIIYNLIMFVTVREKTFAYYLLYVLSYGLYMSVHNGLSFQYLWPENTWLANQSLLFLLSLSLLWGLRFTRSILSTAQLARRSDLFASLLEWLSLVCLVISPFVSYHTMIIPLAILTIIVCGHFLIMAIITFIAGSKPARYYLTAFSALLIAVFAYMLKSFGLAPHNFWTQNAFQVGSLIEMILLSLAVASRLNELKQQSFYDALTQLHNRRYFNQQISLEMQKAQKTGQPLTLTVIDIDHFKQFNDTHGHSEGDKALLAVAKILKSTIRKPFTPCRYGGEEFVLILPNTSTTEAAVIAERVRHQIQTDTANGFGLTVSIGYATTSDTRFNHENELFEAADYALYQAKRDGRNRTMSFENSDHHPSDPKVIEDLKSSGFAAGLD